jgi:hypothetical protein
VGSTRHAENGRILENAQSARARLRKDAAIERERFALRLYASGVKMKDIGHALKMEFGVGVNTVFELIPRALKRAAAEHTEAAEEARVVWLAGKHALLEAHMPAALGSDGVSPPDVKAAEFCNKVIDQIGVAMGAIEKPKTPDQHLHLHMPADPEAARKSTIDRLLELAARDREKLVSVDSHLGAADTSLEVLTGEVLDDESKPLPAILREIER